MKHLIVLTVTFALTACSVAGWNRVGRSTELGYSTTDWGDAPSREAETAWVSVRPLEYLPPPPTATYVVDPPTEDALGFQWPVANVTDEEERAPRWWEDEVRVISVMAAIALAVIGVWKREMLGRVLTGSREKNGAEF